MVLRSVAVARAFALATSMALAGYAWGQEPALEAQPSPTPSAGTETAAAPPPASPDAPTTATAQAAQLPTAAIQPTASPAPMRVGRGARVFVEPTEFGMAVSAAFLKKKVPVVVVTDRDKADFFVQTTSTSTSEKTGERVAKILMFGAFAGSGRRFEGTVTMANRDGAIVFAHNSKKENFQSAAENVAKNLNKHILGQ